MIICFQTKLGSGATLLGVILSSDKTNISSMTGGRSAYPLLISLANISMEFRNKASSNSYLLLALLPIPKFIHSKKRICSMLEARLYHQCLDIILRPLKSAAQFGVMLSDPLGNLRWCFTPLASFIVDTPESQLIATVGGKTSSVTMANYKQFGDDFRHSPRKGEITLNTINTVNSSLEAAEGLEKYEKIAKQYRLNGVQLPFWRNWSLSKPSIFLTSEPLHHWHKQFWDHDVKWCIHAVGGPEIDFRFSVLHPRTGYRRFKEGISKLKQVTGREQRDIQRYIVIVIADAVSPEFLLAIRALMDFRYLAQSPVITEDVCTRISESLSLFHKHKQAITAAGARRGKKGPINHWQIPKLELLQSVVSSIQLNGVACQWSADITEHAHIPLVKDPARSGNNQGYESQICRYLDRLEKIRNFDLAIAIRSAGVHFGAVPDKEGVRQGDEEGQDDEEEEIVDENFTVSSTSELLSLLSTASGYHPESPRSITDFFHRAELIKRGLLSNQSSLCPRRTYRSADNIVYHLGRDPTYPRQSMTDAAQLFCIPDLPAAIGDFISRIRSNPTNGFINIVGGRRLIPNLSPVFYLQIWNKLRLQTTAYHHPHNILPPATMNFAPPSDSWPCGHFDSAIFNTDPTHVWPKSGLTGKYPAVYNLYWLFLIKICVGHVIVDVRLIFRIVPSVHPFTAETLLGQQITSRFLTYVQRYDIVSQQDPADSSQRGLFPEPNTGLFLLKKAMRSNGERIGDIVPLDQIRAQADLAPRFGAKANPKLTSSTSLVYSTEFWLNKYFDKELFYALS